MAETTITVTRDRKPELEAFIRRLPAMLSGRVPDEQGISRGFKARIGWAFFSLVAPNFNQLGRGQAGADGTKWHPLSAEYLAYQRPITGRKRPEAGGKAPGKRDGLLTAEQLKLWNRVFARSLAKFILSQPEAEAKAHAARVAWKAVKAAGGKTKLADPRFGGRQMGVQYQALVDTGQGRRSLQPGELVETTGPGAEYRQADEQRFEDRQSSMVVGTNVKHMAVHHNAKNPNRRRRLWPETFPADWWQQILGVARSGLVRIVDVFGGVA